MSPSVRRPSSDSACGLQWYVVQVQSGREEAVKQALERRARIEGLEEAVGRMLIPVERIAEMRHGRRVERTRKLFSGYLLCEVVFDDRVLALFRETPGVSDFVRSGALPVPLSPSEVSRIVADPSDQKVKVVLPNFDPGDTIRILRGMFAQMEGEVVEVLPDGGQVRVRLTILGRPVQLDMEVSEVLQVAGRE
jgi:transcription termination/antitermination protein NusG